MARPAQYSTDQLLDAALVVLRREGAAGLSVAAVAREAGAPSGSVYHRFASRDLLVGSLWLRAIEGFQRDWLHALVGTDDPLAAARAAARHVLTWSRDHPDEVTLLMLHRSEDLLADGWPETLHTRNRAQRAAATEAIRDLSRRLAGDDRDARRRVGFAVVDVPHGEVRACAARGGLPDDTSLRLVDETVVAVLAPLLTKDAP